MTSNKKKGDNEIRRVNQQYQVVLEYDFLGSRELSENNMSNYIKKFSSMLPIGFNAKELKPSELKTKFDWIILIYIIPVIFLISSILLNSLTKAIIPLFIIPLSFIGIFLSTYLFNFKFDDGGFISFLLVAGLSVNSVLLIANDFNYYNKLRKLSTIKIYLKAFNRKILPIYLTTLSSMLSFLPFIFFNYQDDFWYSLAFCTIGGMVFSFLSIYLFLPIFFYKTTQNIQRQYD